MKHTPGPWEVINELPDCIMVMQSPRTTGGKIKHSICDLHFKADRKEIEANAKLIAEAPLMLEILQELVKDHEAETRDINKEFDTYWLAKHLVQKLEL